MPSSEVVGTFVPHFLHLEQRKTKARNNEGGREKNELSA